MMRTDPLLAAPAGAIASSRDDGEAGNRRFEMNGLNASKAQRLGFAEGDRVTAATVRQVHDVPTVGEIDVQSEGIIGTVVIHDGQYFVRLDVYGSMPGSPGRRIVPLGKIWQKV
jgi:hypothetical protein